jgi:hypothetical protein
MWPLMTRSAAALPGRHAASDPHDCVFRSEVQPTQEGSSPSIDTLDASISASHDAINKDM